MEMKDYKILFVTEGEFDTLFRNRKGLVITDAYNWTFAGIKMNETIKIKKSSESPEELYGFIGKTQRKGNKMWLLCKLYGPFDSFD